MSETMSSTPPTRAAPALARLFQVILGLLVGVVLFDVGLGFYDKKVDVQDSEVHQTDPYLGWVPRPDFENQNTRINSLGLRSPEVPDDASPEEVRIIGVGASRVYGAGTGAPHMDVAWSQVLENFLNSRGERTSWRVLNGGVVSYSGIQSVRRASRLLDVLKPDLILLFVSPGRQMLLSHVQGMRVEQIGDSRIPVDIVSATPSFLHPVLPWLLEILTTSSLYTRYRAALVADIHIPRSYRRYMLSRTPVPSVIEEVLEATFAEFQSLQEKCDRLGIEVRAVVIAEPSQGSEGRWERYLERENKTGAPRPGTDRREPNEVLEERLSAVGVDSWQFFEVIAAMGKQPDHYLCDNFHWSEAGHYLIAQRLLRQMSQEGFLNTLPRSREKKPRE